MFFRPIVRNLPQKSASSLYGSQAGLSSFIQTQQHSYNSNSSSHLPHHNHLTYAHEYHSANTQRHATLTDPYALNHGQQNFTPFITPFSSDHLNLDNLSDKEFRDFLSKIDNEVHYCASKCLKLDYCLTQVKYSSSFRCQLYLETVVVSCYKHNLFDQAEFFVNELGQDHGILPTSLTYYVLMKMQSDKGDWDSFFNWLEACRRTGMSSDFQWDEILTKLMKHEAPSVQRSMELFRTVYTYSCPKLSADTISLAVEAYHSDKQIDTMKSILLSLVPLKEEIKTVLSNMVLDAIYEVNGFEAGLYSLKKVFDPNSKFSKRFKSDVMRYFSTQASSFEEFYYVYLFVQRNDVPEIFLDSLVHKFLKWIRVIRVDFFKHKNILDIHFFQFFLRRLVRNKFEPSSVLEVIQDMKELGLKGREEFKTIIDLFQLNLSLNNKLSLAEKEDYKVKLNLLLPYITIGSYGVSTENTLEAQAVNHRILQSQDPYFCSNEIRNMLSNYLRPSSVAITHTLARFMHIRKYEEGLSLFRHSLPSLKSIAQETGFVSACGPVYNFAIRFCCRIPLISEAKQLVEELESKGGYLDPFASAELIMLLKKTSGHDEAIRGGLSLLSVLKRKKAKIPAFFFNVLFNTLVDAGQHKEVWRLIDNMGNISFNSTAVTYGVLIKAALRDNDYKKAMDLLQKSIDSKVLLAGPSMPIFCQLLEYILAISRDRNEALRLIQLAYDLGLQTNSRFNLFKLRVLSDLEPLDVNKIIPTLIKHNEIEPVPVTHYQSVISNLIRVNENRTAFLVMKMMRENGLSLDTEIYHQVLDGLLQANDMETVNELTSLFKDSRANH